MPLKDPQEEVVHCVDDYIPRRSPIGEHKQRRVPHTPFLEVHLTCFGIRRISPGLRKDAKGVTTAPGPGGYIEVVNAILRQLTERAK